MTFLPRLADKLFNTPLLLLPDTAITIASNLAARFGVEPAVPASDAFRGRPSVQRLNDGSTAEMYRVDNGVAVIPVMGELVNRGAWIGAESGLTSYEGIGAQLRAAAADPNIRGILLDIDSPGGEAAGAMETGDLVREISAKKPVVAFANSLAASAAYWVASGASRIVATPSSQLGSIGVVLLHIDRSEAIAAVGLKPTLIYAGAHKADYSGLRALSDAARARIQASVDETYKDFVASVARNRLMSETMVRGTEGSLLSAANALELGLADEVGRYDGALKYFESGGLEPGMDYEAVIDKLGVSKMGDTISKAEHEAALKETNDAAIRLASQAEEKALFMATDRIRTILGCDAAKGREELAKWAAFETKMPPADALAMLEKAPVSAAPQAAGPVQKLLVPMPAVQPDGQEASATLGDEAAPWASVADELNRKAAANNPKFRIPYPSH